MTIINSTAGLKFLDIINYPEINIKENSFTFIKGKSGSGKSTYLKLLNRTELYHNGEIFYKGKSIQDYPVLDYRKEVLLMPQEVFLIAGSIYENFKFYYDARDEEPLTEEEAKSFLKLAHLNKNLNDDVNSLSGGERQMVFLAIFLSLKLNVFLMDEPTAALDIETSFKLMAGLKKYFKENDITGVCVSHTDEITDEFADYIIEIGGNNGSS